MTSDNVQIINETGLHLKPAAVFCEEALKYESLITFSIGSYTGNAKSILSVLAGCVKKGDYIRITCNGSDEEAALEALKKIVDNGLGENGEND